MRHWKATSIEKTIRSVHKEKSMINLGQFSNDLGSEGKRKAKSLIAFSCLNKTVNGIS